MADTPPRRRRSKTPQTPPEPFSEPAPTEPIDQVPPAAEAPGKPVSVLQKRLEKFIAGMGLPFAAAGDMQCAMVFATRAPVVAEAWATLANESPAVKRVLQNLMKGGAWGGAIATTASLVIPVAAHHGAPIPDPVTAIFLGQEPQPHQEQEHGSEANRPPAA